MFRRSGSVVAYYVRGKIPDPRAAAFAEALAEQRFRSIESAASEETSIGWVTPGDPTGDTFELEDLDLDCGIWLRVRIDKKALPAPWFAIYRSQAERSAGRKLSVREKRELKQDLLERLLPRLLPAVKLVDALYAPDAGIVLLFGTARSLREEFEKLFFRTFTATLEHGEPRATAEHAGLARDALAYLAEVAPVPWHGPRAADDAPPAREPAMARPAIEQGAES